MKKTAIYPGTFDPITFGHIDVIKKALKLFDKVVVAVSDVENKDYLFDAQERKEIVRKALFEEPTPRLKAMRFKVRGTQQQSRY